MRASGWFYAIIIVAGLPAAGTAHGESCSMESFNGSEWAFVRTLTSSGVKPTDQYVALVLACNELDKTKTNGAFAQSHQGFESKLLEFAWTPLKAFGYGSAALSRLNGSTTQERFKTELSAIKPIIDPRVRIRMVYQLVTRYQGQYGDGGIPVRLPGVVLDKAAKEKNGGQCRDFALLLYWSLMQVARHPSNNQGLGELSPNSFSMEPAYGFDSSGHYSGAHVWTRVNLPFKDEKTGRIAFEQIDLDNTFYPTQFAPLSPRQQGHDDSLLLQRKQKCVGLRECILVREVQHGLGTINDFNKRPKASCL